MIVVWFKRDLRLMDHEPLSNAIAQNRKILLLYSFEPLWTKDPHYSGIHLDFIKQSLVDMNNQLGTFNTQILIVSENILEVLKKLHNLKKITHLFSHQETGMLMTFERDKQVAQWCIKQKVKWKESIQNGVLRGRKNRTDWQKTWVSFMNQKIENPRLDIGDFYTTEELKSIFFPLFKIPNLKTVPNP